MSPQSGIIYYITQGAAPMGQLAVHAMLACQEVTVGADICIHLVGHVDIGLVPNMT